MTQQTPLMAQAVALDKLEHPKVREDARALLGKLDTLNVALSRAPVKDRIGHLLKQIGGVDALNMHLRMEVEKAEKTLADIAQFRSHRKASEVTVRTELSEVTTALINEQRALSGRIDALQGELSKDELARQESIATLAKAGLEQEEAEAKAKPSSESLQAIRDKLEAIPEGLKAISVQLGSYAERVAILEAKA